MLSHKKSSASHRSINLIKEVPRELEEIRADHFTRPMLIKVFI